MSASVMLRPALLIAALGVQAVSALAQAPAGGAKPDSSRLAAAHRLLRASGSADVMVTLIKANIPAQRASMPQVPAEFWNRFEQRVVSDAPQLVDSIAVLYSTLFTLPELQQLTAFYESPIGRRFRDVQGDLLTQSTAIGQRWGARIGAEIGASLQH